MTESPSARTSTCSGAGAGEGVAGVVGADEEDDTGCTTGTGVSAVVGVATGRSVDGAGARTYGSGVEVAWDGRASVASAIGSTRTLAAGSWGASGASDGPLLAAATTPLKAGTGKDGLAGPLAAIVAPRSRPTPVREALAAARGRQAGEARAFLTLAQSQP
jgi:hypothetical protein